MFASAVEPHNSDIPAMQSWCAEQLMHGHATLPTTVERELRINPFLRTQQPSVVAKAIEHGATDDSHAAVFTALRLWKDQFAS